MTKKLSRRPKKVPTGNHGIGYARPPESGKIKPGEVRNPWGRTGKPAEELDPFELAMNRQITVKIDGETVKMSGEAAMHIKQLAAAIGGAAGPYKTIVEERRSRRARQVPEPTREELETEAREMDQKKLLSAKIIAFMEDHARQKKASAEPSMVETELESGDGE